MRAVSYRSLQSVCLAALLSAPTLAHAGQDLSSFEGRFETLKEIALRKTIPWDGFPPGLAELAALKLSVNPNDTDTKERLFAILKNRPISSNYTFFPASVIQGYLVAKKAYTAHEKEIFRKYFAEADYKNGGYVWSYAGHVMNKVAVHLICQEWPDLVDSRGNRCSGPDGLAADAKNKLTELLVQSYAGNDGERGSFVYDSFVVNPFKLVATFTKDADIRQAATAAFYSRIVDLAVSWNDGLLTATGQREKGLSSYGPSSPGGSYQIAWLMFGATGQKPVNQNQLDPRFLFDSFLDRQIPEALKRLGQQNRWGMTYYSRADHMYRTFYHSPSYSLVSAAIGGWKWNTWMDMSTTENLLKWQMPRDKETSTLATFRMGNENAAHGAPSPPKDGSAIQMSRYGEGRSPYSRTFQHKGTMIGLSNTPKWDKFDGGSPPERIVFKAQYAMFPNDGSLVEPLRFIEGRWIVANAGSTFFAVYFPKKYRITHRNYKPSPESHISFTIARSDKRRNGWVLETAEASKYAKYGDSNKARFAAFIRDIQENAKIDQSRLNDTNPSLTYKSIHGYKMKFVYEPSPDNMSHKTRFVNDRLVDHPNFPVYRNVKPADKKRKYIAIDQSYVTPQYVGRDRARDPLAKITLTPSGGLAVPKAVINPPK